MPEQPNNDVQKVIIEGQKRLLMNGVVSVDGFSEQQLKLSITTGKVLVLGEDIKITSFNQVNGTLQADGIFTKVSFETEKRPFFKRILK